MATESSSGAIYIPIFLQTELERLSDILGLEYTLRNDSSESDYLYVLDEIINKVENLKKNTSKGLQNEKEKMNKDELDFLKKTTSLEKDLQVTLIEEKSKLNWEEKITLYNKRYQKERTFRKSLEDVINQLQNKILILSQHIEKLMKKIKLDNSSKLKVLLEYRKLQKEHEISIKKIEKYQEIQVVQHRTIQETAQGSKVLEDQLRLMDEKYLELRMKLDTTRTQLNDKIHAVKAQNDELRMKYARLHHGEVLDQVKLPLNVVYEDDYYQDGEGYDGHDGFDQHKHGEMYQKRQNKKLKQKQQALTKVQQRKQHLTMLQQQTNLKNNNGGSTHNNSGNTLLQQQQQAQAQQQAQQQQAAMMARSSLMQRTNDSMDNFNNNNNNNNNNSISPSNRKTILGGGATNASSDRQSIRIANTVSQGGGGSMIVPSINVSGNRASFVTMHPFASSSNSMILPATSTGGAGGKKATTPQGGLPAINNTNSHNNYDSISEEDDFDNNAANANNNRRPVSANAPGAGRGTMIQQLDENRPRTSGGTGTNNNNNGRMSPPQSAGTNRRQSASSSAGRPQRTENDRALGKVLLKIGRKGGHYNVWTADRIYDLLS